MATPDPVLLGVPIELLRQRACLAASDDSRDADITIAFQTAVAMIGDYLDRTLPSAAYTETFSHVSQTALSVKAYPIDMTVPPTLISDGYVMTCHAESATGIIYPDQLIYGHEVTVAYTGGYVTLPHVLQLVAVGTFTEVWGSLNGSTSSGLDIKSMSVPDVGTISYFSPTSSGTGVDDHGMIPAAMISLLAPYKRKFA
jgi:hypothetical protein